MDTFICAPRYLLIPHPPFLRNGPPSPLGRLKQKRRTDGAPLNNVIMLFFNNKICGFSVNKRNQKRRFNFNLSSDFTCAYGDGFKVKHRFVKNGGKKFFHSNGGTAAVDISGKSKKIGRRNHCNAFFSNGFCGFFIIKLAAPGTTKT